MEEIEAEEEGVGEEEAEGTLGGREGVVEVDLPGKTGEVIEGAGVVEGVKIWDIINRVT